VYGGDRSVPRGAVLHHVFPERGGGEPPRRRQRHRRPGAEGTQQPRDQTVHVKKRKHNHRRVRLGESVHRFNVPHGREQVVLSERHALGSACGAGGVKEKRHVIGIVNHGLNRVNRVGLTQRETQLGFVILGLGYRSRGVSYF